MSKVHFIPTSDHAMQMENPQALANTIINDIYDKNLEVKQNPKMLKHFKDHDLERVGKNWNQKQKD